MDNELDKLIAEYNWLLAAQTQQLNSREQKLTILNTTIEKYASQADSNSITTNSHKGKNKSMNYYIPKGCSFFKRKSDNRWEARVRKNGKRIQVACRIDKQYVYKELMKAYRELHPKNPKVLKDKEFTLFSWLDSWHQVYRMPKLETKELSQNTIIMDKSMIRKIKKVFKDKKLKDLTATYIQETLNSKTEGRTAEGVYTVLKLALDKAKDRTGNIEIMALVEKPKHERVRGRALTKEEIGTLLEAARTEKECDVIKFYINTGCRMDELTRTLVEFVNLTTEKRIITNLKFKNKPLPDMTLLPNEILIYGTKTKGSIRSMPIVPPLRAVLEKMIANREAKENLFNLKQRQIIYFYRLIKAKSKIDFTLKDFRHTAATNFKDAGIPSSVYYRWFGWTDETMSKTVYTHETDYEKKVSLEWAEKFK